MHAFACEPFMRIVFDVLVVVVDVRRVRKVSAGTHHQQHNPHPPTQKKTHTLNPHACVSTARMPAIMLTSTIRRHIAK